MPVETIAAAAALVACTYCVFGMTGFGSTVLALPILVYLVPLKFAVSLLLLLDLVASVLLSARSRRGVRLVKWLIGASTAYNIAFVALAASGALRPVWAGLSMLLSSLLALSFAAGIGGAGDAVDDAPAPAPALVEPC